MYVWLFKNCISVESFYIEKAIGSYLKKKKNFMKVLPKRFEYKLLSLCLSLFLIKLHVFTLAFIFLNKFSYESYLKIMFI